MGPAFKSSSYVQVRTKRYLERIPAPYKYKTLEELLRNNQGTIYARQDTRGWYVPCPPEEATFVRRFDNNR